MTETTNNPADIHSINRGINSDIDNALENIKVAIEKNIMTIDSSIGGLGGCPFAPGAPGNVATEDLLYLFHSLGLKTGVDIEAIAKASQFILSKVGKSSPSKYYQSIEKNL